MRLVVCTADCLLTPVDDFNRMSVSSLPSSIAIICHTTCMRATPTGRIAFLVVGGMPLKRMEKAGSHVSRPVGI